MKVEEMNRTAVLLIEAAGLTITAALLFLIAATLKLLLWLATWGAVTPQVGVLAFGFLFYLCAGFLSAGTRDRPADADFVLANVALHAAFLAAAWLLWRPTLSSAWLGFGVALSTTVHAAVCLAARHRARLRAALLQWPAARPAAAVESVFQTHTAPYRALPLGAGLGALLGTLVQAPATDRMRHIAAGVFAALALDALRRLALGAGGLTRELVSEAEVTRVEVRRLSGSDTDPVRVLLPRAAAAPARLEAAAVAVAVRRVLLANQLSRVMIVWLGTLGFTRLALPAPWLQRVIGALLVLSLVATVGCFQLGQRGTNRRWIGRAHGDQAGALKLSPAPSPFASATAWGSVLAAMLLGLVATRCAFGLVLGLLH
jgi:hypothetical protein